MTNPANPSSAPEFPALKILGDDGLAVLSDWQNACFANLVDLYEINGISFRLADLAGKGIQKVLSGINLAEAGGAAAIDTAQDQESLRGEGDLNQLFWGQAAALGRAALGERGSERWLSLASDPRIPQNLLGVVFSADLQRSAGQEAQPFRHYMSSKNIKLPDLLFPAIELAVQHEDALTVHYLHATMLNLAGHDLDAQKRLGIDRKLKKWRDQVAVLASVANTPENIPTLLKARRWLAFGVTKDFWGIWEKSQQTPDANLLTNMDDVTAHYVFCQAMIAEKKEQLRDVLTDRRITGRGQAVQRSMELLGYSPPLQEPPKGRTPPAKTSPELEAPPAETERLIGYQADVAAYWELEGPKVAALAAVNKTLVRGDTGDQNRWVIEPVGKDSARRMQRLLHRVAALMASTSAIQTQRGLANSRALEASFGDRLKRMPRVTPPPALLESTLAALLGKDGEKWPDMQGMLKEHWPKDLEPKGIEWDLVGKVLLGQIED